MSFYFRLLRDISITLYLLDWLSRKTHFFCAVVKIRLAFRSPLLTSGRTLKTIQRAETTSCLSTLLNEAFASIDLRMSAPAFAFALLLRKEVIQPHLPIRLPCYDFTPVIDLTLGCWLLSVTPQLLGAINSHGVTGGVYKARERIHRGMLIRDY